MNDRSKERILIIQKMRGRKLSKSKHQKSISRKRRETNSVLKSLIQDSMNTTAGINFQKHRSILGSNHIVSQVKERDDQSERDIMSKLHQTAAKPKETALNKHSVLGQKLRIMKIKHKK